MNASCAAKNRGKTEEKERKKRTGKRLRKIKR
jgi:hypothetical protein